MKIESLKCGELESNCYIIYQRDGGECWIIDPGDDAERIIGIVRAHSLIPKGILLTHHHYDHCEAAAGVLRAYDVPVYIHEAEVRLLDIPAVGFSDGDLFDLEGERIEVISTPGHSKGSVCFMCPESGLAFTGDTVFRDDMGSVAFEGGSRQELIRTAGDIVDKWDDDLMIYPGHFDISDMKHVKESNVDFLKAMKRYKCL